MKFKRIHLFSPLVIPMLILSLMISFSSCTHENEEKILGEWALKSTSDGLTTIHYFEFKKGKKRNQFIEKIIPVSTNTIGFEVKGNWEIDFAGDLYLKYDLQSLKPLTKGVDDDDLAISTFMATTKLKMAAVNEEEGYVELSFNGNNKMTVHTAFDDETFHRPDEPAISSRKSTLKEPVTTYEEAESEETDVPQSFQPGGQYDEFVGLIDGKYKINMQLNLTAGEGRYYYLNSGSGDYLDLEVTSYNPTTGKITIIERNDKGQQTGKFEGTLHSDGNMNGWFTNYKGKEMPFSLDPNNAP